MRSRSNTITFSNRISWPCQIAFNLRGPESKPLERTASIRDAAFAGFTAFALTIGGSSFDAACNEVLRHSEERRENFALCSEERGKIEEGKITGVREQVFFASGVTFLFL